MAAGHDAQRQWDEVNDDWPVTSLQILNESLTTTSVPDVPVDQIVETRLGVHSTMCVPADVLGIKELIGDPHGLVRFHRSGGDQATNIRIGDGYQGNDALTLSPARQWGDTQYKNDADQCSHDQWSERTLGHDIRD